MSCSQPNSAPASPKPPTPKRPHSQQDQDRLIPASQVMQNLEQLLASDDIREDNHGQKSDAEHPLLASDDIREDNHGQKSDAEHPCENKILPSYGEKIEVKTIELPMSRSSIEIPSPVKYRSSSGVRIHRKLNINSSIADMESECGKQKSLIHDWLKQSDSVSNDEFDNVVQKYQALRQALQDCKTFVEQSDSYLQNIEKGIQSANERKAEAIEQRSQSLKIRSEYTAEREKKRRQFTSLEAEYFSIKRKYDEQRNILELEDCRLRLINNDIQSFNSIINSAELQVQTELNNKKQHEMQMEILLAKDDFEVDDDILLKAADLADASLSSSSALNESASGSKDFTGETSDKQDEQGVPS